MAFEIRHLRYAVAAGDTGSFAKAARHLRVKQSTLSRTICVLEERLGMTIFERSTQGAAPTKAGADFLEIARRIVNEIDGLRKDARAIGRGEAGVLSIGFSTSLSAGNLRAVVLYFRQRFPEVQVRGIEAGWDILSRGVMSRTIDVAIVPGALPGDGLAKRHLWPERLMVALPEDHPAAAAERIFWSDLRDEIFVLPKRDPGPDAADLVKARLRGIGTPRILVEDITRENILNFVSAERFVSLVAETAAGTQHPGVVLREIHDLAGLAHVDFWAWWREDNENPALKRFFRLVADRYPGFAS